MSCWRFTSVALGRKSGCTTQLARRTRRPDDIDGPNHTSRMSAPQCAAYTTTLGWINVAVQCEVELSMLATAAQPHAGGAPPPAMVSTFAPTGSNEQPSNEIAAKLRSMARASH